MTPAYYAEYTSGYHGAPDRIGGLPTHLPPEYPNCQQCGVPLTFVMQLYVDEMNLFDESWLALHLYECEPCSEQLLLALDRDAKRNTENEGVPLLQVESKQNTMGASYSPAEWGEQVEWQDVTWKQHNDPEPTSEIEQFWDGSGPKKEYAYLFQDKLGGCFPCRDDGGVSAKTLGTIGQFTCLRHTLYLFNDPQRGLYCSYF